MSIFTLLQKLHPVQLFIQRTKMFRCQLTNVESDSILKNCCCGNSELLYSATPIVLQSVNGPLKSLHEYLWHEEGKLRTKALRYFVTWLLLGLFKALACMCMSRHSDYMSVNQSKHTWILFPHVCTF